MSFWIPLDPVPSSCGVRFVAGSHRWGRWFIPRRFVDHVPYGGADDRFELVPDIDAELDRHRIVVAPVEPGDVIAFHFRTLHDAPGTEGLSTRRRVVSLRWLGDDATSHCGRGCTRHRSSSGGSWRAARSTTTASRW